MAAETFPFEVIEELKDDSMTSLREKSVAEGKTCNAVKALGGKLKAFQAGPPPDQGGAGEETKPQQG